MLVAGPVRVASVPAAIREGIGRIGFKTIAIAAAIGGLGAGAEEARVAKVNRLGRSCDRRRQLVFLARECVIYTCNRDGVRDEVTGFQEF